MATSDSDRSSFTIDHAVIRAWAGKHDARPARVRGTATARSVGIIRFIVPDRPPHAEALDAISWEDFFAKFEQERLALVYEEKTAEGNPSSFHRLVGRDQFHE